MSPPTQNDSSLSSLLRRLYVDLSQLRWDVPFLLAILIFESALSILIVKKVPYTEIDWVAYMQEVDTYEAGERDYLQIRGGTGPLVYPAGFLYLYGMLKRIAGGGGSDVYTAQLVFVGLYVVNAAVVLALYTLVARERRQAAAPAVMASAHTAWSWRIAMGLCCLSKRVHSIFVLRLFNDAPAMFLLYVSTLLFAKSKWRFGCFFFSLGVSIKMNVLLFAPGLLLLLLQSSPDLQETIVCLAICAAVQLVLGAPFLLTYPVSYLRKAFELDRVFFYKWTVNWKFLPEDIFVSKPLSLALLALHLGVLALLAVKWLNASKTQVGSRVFLLANKESKRESSVSNKQKKQQLSPEYVTYTMFVSNYIGICFARTLHYQFYSWYFYTLPFLLWCTDLPMPLRVALMGGIEYAFNVFPATAQSSAVLQAAHAAILLGIGFAKVPRIFQQETLRDVGLHLD